MIFTILIAFIVLFLSVLIFYEILNYTWFLLNQKFKIRTRRKVIFITIAITLGHLIIILIYALIYKLLYQFGGENFLIVNTIPFEPASNDLLTLTYFSATTYSSLGYGDLAPLNYLRIISLVQVINGLVLIAWSASVIFLTMQNSWERKR